MQNRLRLNIKRGEKKKTTLISKPVAFFFLADKLALQGYIIRPGTKPALPFPPSQTVGSASSDTRGETGTSLSRKVWACFLA